MSCTGLKTSKKIETFLTFYDEAVSTYKYCYEKVNECEKLECDLKHKLELGNYVDVNEERRILTQLKYCLRDRRYYKDRVEELSPFVDLFLSKDKDKDNIARSCITAVNHMRQALGNVRKAENYHADRTYKPRILKDEFGEQK
jgi:hypothetical protein